MKVRFLGDFRGKITNEVFFIGGAVVDFEDGTDDEDGVGEAVVKDKRAKKTSETPTHRGDGLSHEYIKEMERRRKKKANYIALTAEERADESLVAAKGGISVEELQSRMAIAAEDEVVVVEPKKTRKRRTKK